MPWSETSPMDQRMQFIADYCQEFFSTTELCERYGISRKTGYKWISRYQQEGPPGLEQRTRRPHSCPYETPSEIVEAILKVRRRHPSWGAKKLLVYLRRHEPNRVWPGRTTVCDILKRHGLIPAKRRRRHIGHPGRPDTPMNAPNDIWTADFKGEFKTLDGQYPLTAADGFSRYLLGCRSLTAATLKLTRPVFTHSPSA